MANPMLAPTSAPFVLVDATALRLIRLSEPTVLTAVPVAKLLSDALDGWNKGMLIASSETPDNVAAAHAFYNALLTEPRACMLFKDPREFIRDIQIVKKAVDESGPSVTEVMYKTLAGYVNVQLYLATRGRADQAKVHLHNAKHFLRDAVNLEPNNAPLVRICAASMIGQLDMTEVGAKHLERLIESSLPDTELAHFPLGKLYFDGRHVGDTKAAKARDHFQKFLEGASPLHYQRYAAYFYLSQLLFEHYTSGSKKKEILWQQMTDEQRGDVLGHLQQGINELGALEGWYPGTLANPMEKAEIKLALALIESAGLSSPMLPQARCSWCLKPAKVSACGRCARVAYCSAECQKAHWVFHHKERCAQWLKK